VVFATIFFVFTDRGHDGRGDQPCQCCTRVDPGASGYGPPLGRARSLSGLFGRWTLWVDVTGLARVLGRRCSMSVARAASASDQTSSKFLRELESPDPGHPAPSLTAAPTAPLTSTGELR
jgi:hypothetical protein